MTAPRRRPSPPWARRASGLMHDLRGGVRLAVDGMHGLIALVETVHQRVADLRPPVRAGVGRPSSGVAAVVYRGLRGTTDLLGGGLDLALASTQAALQDPWHERDAPPPLASREALVAALNAVAGDHLHHTDNPLATATSLRVEGTPRPRVVVLVHDLGLNDLQWRQGSRDFGAALATGLDASVVYVRYNTGRAVWSTARELVAELEALLSSWREPLQRVALVGHGLGGLVVRSALHQGLRSGRAWPAHIGQLVFLGTPHAGTHGQGWRLEGLGATGRSLASNAVLGLAALARRESVGMADFATGNLLEHDPRTGQPLRPDPLPTVVRAYAVAGAADGLVPVASALGHHDEPDRALQLPETRQWIAEGVDHLGLLASDAVLRRVQEWLAA